MNMINEITKQITDLDAPGIVFGVCCLIALALKRSAVNDRWILWATMAFGAVAFPFCIEQGTVVWNSNHPEITTAVVGAGIGGVAGVVFERVYERFFNRKPTPEQRLETPGEH